MSLRPGCRNPIWGRSSRFSRAWRSRHDGGEQVKREDHLQHHALQHVLATGARRVRPLQCSRPSLWTAVQPHPDTSSVKTHSQTRFAGRKGGLMQLFVVRGVLRQESMPPSSTAQETVLFSMDSDLYCGESRSFSARSTRSIVPGGGDKIRYIQNPAQNRGNAQPPQCRIFCMRCQTFRFKNSYAKSAFTGRFD